MKNIPLLPRSCPSPVAGSGSRNSKCNWMSPNSFVVWMSPLAEVATPSCTVQATGPPVPRSRHCDKSLPSNKTIASLGGVAFSLNVPGVTIGDECVVAPASVVMKDVPSNTLVAGEWSWTVTDGRGALVTRQSFHVETDCPVPMA